MADTLLPGAPRRAPNLGGNINVLRKLSVLVLLSALVPLSVVAALLGPVSAAHATTAYPTLTVSGPSRGNPVTEIDGVFATGSVDPAGSDTPKTLALFFNGTLSDSRPCNVPAGTKTCTLSLLFDASALDGPQTVRVDFTTAQGHVVSSTQTIVAYTPPPVASLTAPADHSTAAIGDQVEVDTTGSSSEIVNNPRTMDLLVDGVSVEQDHCPFPGDGHTCPDTFTWDTSGLAAGVHTLQAKMTTYHNFVALSPLRHVTLTTPVLPTVVLTAPAAGTVTDQVYVSATGSVTAGSGDSPYGMVLVVDGHTFGSTELCPSPQLLSCTLGLLWDTTGLSGQHTVAVRFFTSIAQATSSAVTVTVVNPPPTVTITSPLANASVSGITQVTASGTIDDRQLDYARSLQLVVDGSPSGAAVLCGVSRTTCTTTFAWDTAGLSGQHQLQVRFDTQYASVTSAATPVTVPTVAPQPVATTLTLTAPSGPFDRGSWGAARGTLTNTATHAPVAGAPVHVVFTPLKGAPSSVDVLTAADASFVATDPRRLQLATTVQASTGADFGSASATETLSVRVRIGCHAPKRLHHGLPATIICTTPGLAFGSVVTLHYAQDGHGVVYGKVVNGTVRFSLTVAAKGWVKLWATTATTRSYVASASRPSWVHVR